MSRSTARHDLLRVGLLGSLVVVAACGSATPATAPPTAASPSVAAVAAPSAPPAADCTPTAVKFDTAATQHLTGLYAADDGGIYYLRQRGNIIWWSGMSDRAGPADELGRTWNNVGRGELGPDMVIHADWVDVPRGQIQGYGTVDFKVGADASGNLHIIKTTETGTGRGDNIWTPCTLAT